MRIFDWKARRSGATMTIAGKDSGGATAAIVGVTAISSRSGRVYAVDQAGEEHEMVLA